MTSAELTPERLDELDRRAREAAERASRATPGRWKLWGMDVYADQDGTSNVDTAKCVAATYFVDEHGYPRTFDATFIAAARQDVPELSAALLAATAEVRRLREREAATARDRVTGALLRSGFLDEARLLATSDASPAYVADLLRAYGSAFPERDACIAAVEALASGEPPRAGEERKDG